jgi:hypothetical protein
VVGLKTVKLLQAYESNESCNYTHYYLTSTDSICLYTPSLSEEIYIAFAVLIGLKVHNV